MGLASINVRFNVDMKQFSTEMQSSLRTLAKVEKQISQLGRNMSTYITAPVLLAGAASIKFASDYNESLNKVDVSFKTSAQGVRDFAKTSLDSFGIAEGTALDMASSYGDMATSMGLPVSQAAKMSTSLVGLAGDLASFKNISIDIANTAVTAIFSGETESLKKLGIVMTEVNLKHFAMASGIKNSYEKMTQAEKVQLRYNYILSVTKNAQGDFTRTAGGSANQMRIFTESLKQIGQQIGAVILPLFTKAISFINQKIKAFGNLSETTKTVIVVVAGLAAAIGPLLVGIGFALQAVPLLSAGFLFLSANILPIVAGITILTSLFYIFSDSTEKVVTSKEKLNKVMEKGNQLATSEVANLDLLYSSATNVKTSLNDRKAAIDTLQSSYPLYFKNLDAENFKNGQAKDVYNELREAIFNKSRAMAIDNELQARANERITTELKLRKDVSDTEAELIRIKQSAGDVTIKGSRMDKEASIVLKKSDLIAAQTKLLEIQNQKLRQFTATNLKEDQLLYNAKQDISGKLVKLTQNEKAQADLAAKASKDKAAADAEAERIKTLGRAGTIKFYESEISLLQAQQKEVATTAGQYELIGNKIEAIQKKIDAIKNKEVAIKFVKPAKDEAFVAPNFDNPTAANYDAPSLDTLKANKSYYEQLRDQFSKTSEKYKEYTDTINGIQIKISEIDGTPLDNFSAKMEQVKAVGISLMQTVSTAVGEGLTSAFSAMSDGIVASLDLANSGFEGFEKGLISTTLKLISMFLAQSISSAIAGATASGAATGPGAIFTTPAFIAAAVSGVIGAFAAIPKFADGGVVGGSSFYGDKILARVNSGELMLNHGQQKSLHGMLDSNRMATNVAVQLMGGFEIEGTKLRLVLDRADKLNNRLK